MSTDISMYTRDRPVLDERQNMELGRDPEGVTTWALEEWLYGGLSISIESYRYDDHREEELVDKLEGQGEEPPAWAREMRWKVHAGNGRADEDFIYWFRGVAAANRGVVLNSWSGKIEVPESRDDQGSRAWAMMQATRPTWSDWNDALTDLQRRGPDGLRLAPTDYLFGADLAKLAARGLRLSWEAAQYVCLVCADIAVPRFLVMPDDHADLVAGPRGSCAAAIVALTTHADPTVDRLMRDEPTVLRDYLLERDQPVDPLLCALVGDVPMIEVLPDSAALRDELVAFWEGVIAADPMLGGYSLAELGVQRPRYQS